MIASSHVGLEESADIVRHIDAGKFLRQALFLQLKALVAS